MAALDLEDAASDMRAHERRSRRLRNQERRRAVEAERKAARIGLARTLISSAAQAASGAVQAGRATASLGASGGSTAEIAKAKPQPTAPQSTETPQTTEASEEVAGKELSEGPSEGSVPEPTEAERAELDSAKRSARREHRRARAREGLRAAAPQEAQAALAALDGGLMYAQERQTQDASTHESSAEQYQDATSAADEAADRAQSFSEKAMGHLEQVARASHEAMMAALRA